VDRADGPDARYDLGMAENGIVVPLLDGFEEIEAVTIIDVLRRAELPVLVAGEARGIVKGNHAIGVQAEIALAEIDASAVRAVVLPGGMPGAANLSQHPEVQSLIQQVAAAGKYTAAICAGPIALAAAGVLEGRTATCYPGLQDKLDGATFIEEGIVVDGPVITSRGPGTAMEFALTLVGLLVGGEVEAKLGERMLVHRSAEARRIS
jgi:protein deglycase